MEAFNTTSNRLSNQQGNQKSSGSVFFQWWYNLTSVPEPPADASFAKRELVRRSHLVSLLTLFLLVIFLIYLPNNLTTPIHLGTFTTGITLPISLVAILLNRSQRIFTAGMIMVISIELTLTVLIIATRPSDELSVGQYTLLILGEILAVSLLPPSTVLFVGGYNIAFTIGSLLFLPHTPTLTQSLHHQFVGVAARPILMQFLVAVVSYIWVKGTLRAIARADKAELTIALERQIAEEKLQLEENINQIVQSHIDTMNNKVVTRIPFSEETKVLWPLINVIDSLQKRLRASQQAENELQRLKKAILGYTDLIYQGKGLPSQQQWAQTKTELDMLLHAIKQQGYPPSHHNYTTEGGNQPLNKLYGTPPGNL